MDPTEITEVPVESIVSESNVEEKPEINLDLTEDVPNNSSSGGAYDSLMNFLVMVKIVLLRLLSLVNSHFFTFIDELKDLYNESKQKMN